MTKYLILILPPQDIINYVDQFRNKYAKYTSYIIPPHITIYPPFYLKDNVLETDIIDTVNEQINKN